MVVRSRITSLQERITELEAEVAALRSGAAVPSTGAKVAEASTSGHGRVQLPPGSGIVTAARARSTWLALFLASLSLTAMIMGQYEAVLEHNVQLAYFVPLLIGHGGNVGGQVVGALLQKGRYRGKGAGRITTLKCIALFDWSNLG